MRRSLSERIYPIKRAQIFLIKLVLIYRIKPVPKVVWVVVLVIVAVPIVYRVFWLGYTQTWTGVESTDILTLSGWWRFFEALMH